MIKLLTPENGANVVLLREKHLEYIANPITDPDESGKIEWLNLKASKQDMSYPNPVLFSYTPEVDGEIVISSEGKPAVKVAAVAGKAEVSNFYIDTGYEWYVRIGEERSETFSFHTDAQFPRMLYVDGISNVRDIGGLYTANGKRIKQGIIYRTSEMDTHVDITEEGKRVLVEDCGIRTDVDIRGINKEHIGPVLDESRVRWINYPMAAYIDIFNETQMELYRQSFELLAEEGVCPLMIHCWGGIDRTGCWLYILCGMLGVDADMLGLDYEMSSFSRWNRRSRNHPQFKEFLEALHKYGDGTQNACTGFLLACGVKEETLEKIKTLLLEDAV